MPRFNTWSLLNHEIHSIKIKVQNQLVRLPLHHVRTYCATALYLHTIFFIYGRVYALLRNVNYVDFVIEHVILCSLTVLAHRQPFPHD